MDKLIITLTGKSGAGKSTLAKDLEKLDIFREAVSVTTREMRNGEADGVHYHFINQDEFDVLKSAGHLVESIEFADKAYGLTDEEVAMCFQQEKIAVFVCEPHGVEQVAEFCDKEGWDHVAVFIDVPTDLQYQRLVQRFNSDMDEVKTPDEVEDVKEAFVKRLVAVREVEPSWRTDFDYHMYIENYGPDTDQSVQRNLKVLGKNYLKPNKKVV